MPSEHELAEGRRFDVFAPDYDDTIVEMRERARRAATEVLRWAGVTRLVDVGCGTGTLLLSVADTLTAGVGLDVSSRMLDAARQKAGEQSLDGLSFRSGSFSDLSDPSFVEELRAACGGRVDGIVSTYAMHHLDRDAKAAAIDAMASIVDPDGGCVVIGDLMRFGTEEPPSMDRHYVGYDPDWDRPEPVDWLTGRLASSGFVTRTEHLHPMVGIVAGVARAGRSG